MLYKEVFIFAIGDDVWKFVTEDIHVVDSVHHSLSRRLCLALFCRLYSIACFLDLYNQMQYLC